MRFPTLEPTLVFSALLWIPYLLPAQPSEVPFERISIEHGLSQSSVFSIVQDHQGFMWFGTQDGLNKYDGYRFTVYRRDPNDPTTISGNLVARLMVDSEGNVWAGTTGGGVSRYDPGSGRFERFLEDITTSNSLSNNRVWALHEDRAGLIWVGTQSGLNSYNKKTRTWRRYYVRPEAPGDFQNSVWSVYQDSAGVYWVDCGRAITQFDPATGTFTRIQRESATNIFMTDRNGTLWSYGEAARRFDPRKNQFVPARFPQVSGGTVLPGGEGFLQSVATGDYWFGTYTGLVRVDGVNGTATKFVNNPNDPESLSENSILSVYEDRSGIIWVGTFQGINKYVPTKKKFRSYTHNPKDPNSLSGIRVRGFAEDTRGMVWIVTQKGINRFDPVRGRFTRFLPEPGNPHAVNAEFYWSVAVDHQFPPLTVWAGANGPGVTTMVFQGEETRPQVSVIGSERLSNTSVTAVYQDNRNDLWFGQLEGATWYRRKDDEFLRLELLPGAPRGLRSATIPVIGEDRNGTLWLGSYGLGLMAFSRETKTFRHFFHEPDNPVSLSDNNVISFHEDHDGILWFGTYRGVNRFDPGEGTFLSYTTAHGLPNNVIYGILGDDQGNLWLSTNKGLSKFNPGTGTATNYDIGDGLQSNEFNQGASLRTRNGTMYFGGINGFNMFHPDSVALNPNIPGVVFTDFRIFNRSVEAGPEEQRIRGSINTVRELFLSYADAVLTFEFSALEYTASGRNRYAYYLEGFEPTWNYVGDRREATYTNLDPGSYVFRVKASNNDGVWNERGASIMMHIAPPWWMTGWFRAIVVIAFLSVGPIIYFRRVGTLKREHALQQEVSRRLLESQEQERKRIAAELHDGLGQELLIISNRTQMAQDATKPQEWVAEQLREISESARAAIQSVRIIAHNLRPYQIDRVGLTKAIESILKHVDDSSHIRFSSEIDPVDGLFPKEHEIHVYRIVQESINNILKHSRATEAGVLLNKGRTDVSIKIRDNGIGFDSSPPEPERARVGGFGLSGMTERVRILGGDITMETPPNGGTVIRISIPLSHRFTEV